MTRLEVERITNGAQLADLSKLRFRDPSSFQAGALRQHLEEWLDIIENPPPLQQMEVLKWVQDRVSVFHYFRYLKGNYKGVNYDSERPPTRQFKNNPSCRPFGDFIRRTLLERLATGAIAFVGRVGEVTPPYLVLPLTMEPTKPRLCHDARFLNLWMKDTPFKLDTLANLPRYVTKKLVPNYFG